MALLMTYVNIRGVKTAAIFQSILTIIIGGAGIILIASSAVTGDLSNLKDQSFVGTGGTSFKNVMAVAVTTPPSSTSALMLFLRQRKKSRSS